MAEDYRHVACIGEAMGKFLSLLLWFMAALYALAVVIYVGSRLYRRSQGMDLSMAYGEIPAE